MKLSLNKSHLVLAALVIALGAAVYLNWSYSESEHLEPAESSSASDAQETEETANYGDAYFVEARLSRTQSRDEAMDSIKYMLEDAKLDQATVKSLAAEAQAVAKRIETEGKIENIIKAKGFAECMVYLEQSRADVIVKSSGLSDQEAAQIMDAVLTEAELPYQNVSIIEIK